MLRGSIEEFSLADIFRLLSSAKKTGRLEAHNDVREGRVLFQDGDVVFAQSSSSQEPLGHKLVRSGALSEVQLRKALDLHATTGERVGEILVRTGTISDEQLATAVREQVEDAVFDLLRWDAGDFTFDPDERLTVEIPISVSVENLIMEAARRLDELELIKRRIPSPDVVLAVAPSPPEGAREISITPDEWRMLVAIDGSRTVGEIVASAALDDFAGLKTLYGLVSSGLVEVVSFGPDETHAESTVPVEPPDQPVAPADDLDEPEPAQDVAPATDEFLAGVLAGTPGAAEPDPPPEGQPVDRAAVVRELAGLFNEDDEGASAARPPRPRTKRRVEDDEDVDKRLIGRFINGVKGM
jgi:hypothetical protein